MRPADERYFARIEERLDEAFERAEAARARGLDPSTEIEIPVARDMADRVENILEIPGVAERVRELEGDLSREEAALELVTDFVEGTVGEFDSREAKIEGAVRTAVALLTEGVVAAPIEGIDRVELLENDDGSEFVNVYYAGPIRSAGGTAQALSVLVADYARSLLGVDEYRARGEEIERYAEEVSLYDSETGLQYTPKSAETKFVAEHMPIMLDGEATGDEEVSGFRDLDRVDTNAARGGMCLVLAEGIALKAPKIQRYTRQLEEVDWPWLQDLIDGTYGEDGGGDQEPNDEEASSGAEAGGEDSTVAEEPDDDGPAGPPRVEPSSKYLRDLIAGRPVFGHPSEPGGFRLRYGRARNHGFATAGVHPATMHLVDDFLATGTQIKTERPGKAGGVVPVDSIEGPTVKLANGDVRRIDDPAEALEVRNGVEEILDLGEYLVNYGEFVENNHPLAPASYVVEWWEQDLAAAGADLQALRDDPRVDLADPDAERALEWAAEYDAPLHPTYTYCWHDVSVADFEALARAVAAGEVVGDVLAIENTDRVRGALETLLVEHSQTPDSLRVPDFRPLLRQLGVTDGLQREWEDLSREAREWAGGDNAVAAVREVAPFAVRERAPTRIGNRMGRPEKSESRELSPAVHALFPIGDAGGSQRSIGEAAGARTERGRGVVDVLVGERACVDCGEHTYETRCPECGGHTEPHYECDDCGIVVDPDESGRVECPRCDREVESPAWHTIDVGEAYRDALDALSEREANFEILKGVKGLTSANRTPEPLEKGILRAKHGVSAFKDGTVRYDMTDLPVTAVRPAELDVTAEHFRELGYETDVDGEPLVHDDQLVELKVQDVVLSDGAAAHMARTADFVDELLADVYDQEPFYEVTERDDLVGELVFGMAPHTSAAVVGRVVGFTSAAVGYAHPYFHASKRRNCFHPDTKLWYQDEAGAWHFGRIDEFVEERLNDPDEDDFGTLVQELDGEVLVPSVTDDGEETLKPVEAVSKHSAPEHMVQVETRGGREITVTPDHELLRWRDGVEKVEAHQLDVGDSIPTQESMDFDGRRKTFDLLAEFIDCDAVPNEDLVIRGLGEERIRKLFNDSTDERGYLKPVADRLGVCQSTAYNWVNRDSVPVGVLLKLFERDALIERLPSTVRLGVRRDDTTVERFPTVDEEFAMLLGYYAAEGFTRRAEGEFYQTTICIPDRLARKHIIDSFRESLGVDAFEENEWKVTVSSRLVASLFEDILDAGCRAEEKRIPAAIMSSPREVLRSFLSGYFSGDGSASSNRVEIRAHTVSDELVSDLVVGLKRFGIAVKTYTERRTVDTGVLAEFYDESPEFETNVLKVTSENAARYSEQIGFHLPRKDAALTEALATVDVRPQRLFGDGGDVLLDEVESVKYVEADTDYTYCLTVENTHTLVANDLFVGQCDGDEDCIMLLMDGLLNFSREYLPDKRGGSVAEDSRLVAFDPKGDVRFTTFGEFWEELDVPIERDGKFEKKTCFAEGWETYAFDEEHRSAPMPIEKAIRYRAGDDERLLRVESQFGRSIDVTGNHSLFRYDDGIEEVECDELSEGDLLVAPRQLSVETERTRIDVADCVPDPYVFVDDRVESYLTRVWEDAARGSETRAAFDGGLSYHLSKNKTALGTLDDIEEVSGDERGDWTPTIGLQGSSTGIDRYVDVDEGFAWLLGMFVAEGSLSGVRPTIHNSDDELVDRVVDYATDSLGTEPSVRWSNKSYEIAFPAVFREVLYDLGFEKRESYNSSEKVVPECVLRADLEVAKAFLRGFIAGDGSETNDDNHTTVGFYTTSEDVKDGIVFLLHRVGLVANVSRRERDENRQPIYAVTVSGGAADNPLRRILDGDRPYHPKSLVVTIPDALREIREMDIPGVKRLVPKHLKRRENVSLEKLRDIVAALDERDLPPTALSKLEEIRPLVDGDLSYLRITNIEHVEYDGYLYDLQVGGEPVFTANWLYAHNSMDAPLVMSSRIDPAEIDDEAHNMDVAERYPREFYEATLRMADPEEVDVELAGDSLGTDDRYRGFAHTHDTSDVALGPDLSAYKTLGSMMEKMDAQLELARKLRAVDETDVAERVIEYHFLPDLIGNLRAFSRQETRCLDCGEKYRRMPLTGDCRACGGDVTLTVHRGSVNKYMDAATRIAEEFGCREYTKQRLEILDRSLESVFENDKNKQGSIADFM